MKFKKFSGTGSPFQAEPKYIHVGKVLVEDNGYSRQLLLRCSNDSHPCENLIKINNTACKTLKSPLGSLPAFR
ncbi:hypothetical protein FGD67_04185 [Colwellia sp. M166]|nr:hypothetical protein FGD67_04185 [Colwellia sp. M166]